MKPHITLFAFLFIISFFLISPANATWPENGILVFSAGAYEDSPTHMISAGEGAVILAMYSEEYHGYACYGVVQKIDTAGVLQWDPAHWLSGPGQWSWPSDIVSDGAGGVFAAYGDYMLTTRSYAERIYWDGSSMNLPLCTEEEGSETESSIITDGAGNAITAFAAYPPGGGSNKNIYAQRNSAAGSPLWGTCGTGVCTVAEWQSKPRLVYDDAGGAIIVWEDSRNGGANADLYAQRMNSGGAKYWATDGIPVCNAPGNQTNHQVMEDGEGGAFIAWQDKRSGNLDIYAQRINSTGAALWDSNGVEVCTAKFDQDYPLFVADEMGGAIIVWRDRREGDYDVYAQRFDEFGNMLWQADGRAIAAGTGNQRCQRIAKDGVGGAIIAWVDEAGSDYDVYAQRINDWGYLVWTGDRVPVCTAGGNQDNLAMASVATGAAIIAWKDERSGEPFVSDVYAMMVGDETVTSVSDDGSVIPYSSSIAIVNYPNPFNPGTRITYRITGRNHVSLDVYDITGRRIKCLVDREKEDGSHTIEWKGNNEQGNPVGSGVYFARLKAGSTTKITKMVILR